MQIEEREKVRFDLLLMEGFVLTEYTAVVDILRLANRVTVRPVFEWRNLSAKGGPVSCLSDATVTTVPFDPYPDAHYVVALGNSDPACPGLSLGREIDRYLSRQCKVILLSEAASRFISERGDHTLTTHWENRTILGEKIGLETGNQALATEQGLITTSAGMGSTVDMILTLMARHISAASISTVADIQLHERIRDPGTLQPFGGQSIKLTGDEILDMCIGLMQANMEEPLPISELVRLVGVSSRSLERRFQALLDTRPAEYYRALRLNKASNLLLNTTMPVSGIALACGFPSGFTRHYRMHFGLTPQAVRRRVR